MVRDNSKKEEEDRERREKDGREKAREIEKKMKEREVCPFSFCLEKRFSGKGEGGARESQASSQRDPSTSCGS